MKRLLSILLLCGLIAYASDDSNDRRPPSDNLIAVSFNTESALDRSSYNRAPTVSSGATFATRCADFDGTSNAVVSYSDEPEVEDPPFSICCWIRIDAYTGYRCIASKIAQTGTYNGWHLFYGPSLGRGLDLGHSNSSSAYRQAWTASGDLTAGTWYHVAATLSALNATAVLYINGVAKSTTTVTGGTVVSMAGTDLLRIAGKGGPDFTSYHDGGIDDFRMFNRVLSATEVAALYSEGLGVTRP